MHTTMAKLNIVRKHVTLKKEITWMNGFLRACDPKKKRNKCVHMQLKPTY